MTAAVEEVQHRTRVEWATVPRVNLLPDEIVQARRFRATQRWMALAVAGTVLLGAAATGWAQLQVGNAQAGLDAAKQRTASLNREATRYAEVPKVLAQVDAARAAREQAMGGDILWYRFLNDLANATPANVWLGSVTVSTGTGQVAPDPLTPAGLGTVTIAGNAQQYADVASWLTEVAQVHGLDASRLQSAAKSGDATAGAASSRVTFAGTVVITPAALSHRYDRKAD